MSGNDSRDDDITAAAERASEVASATGDAASGAQQLASDPAGAATAAATSAAGAATSAAAGAASSAAGAATSAAAQQAQQAQQAISSAGQAVSSAQKLQNDPVGGLLGLVGGAAGLAGAAASAGEAAQALSTASQVASAASGVAGAVSALSRSDAGSSPSAPAGGDEAQAYGNIGPSADSAVWPGLGESADALTMAIEIAGLEDVLLGLRSVDLDESVNHVPTATIEVRCDGVMPEARSLLGAECTIRVDRSVQTRAFHGLMHHVEVEETAEGAILRANVSPALWLLQWVTDSRIYQNQTVIEVVTAIYQEKLGGREREIRDECERTYEAHEYLVQYNESYLSFIDRLLESEGIFYYFDHEGDREVLVLADTVGSRPKVRSEDDGQVPFWEDAEQAPDHEAITEIHHADFVGPTDVVVRGYDWTNPAAVVSEEQTGRGDGEPALERYEHLESVTYHQYDGAKFSANTAKTQATMRVGLLDLARQHWQMQATVVTAQPGHVFEVSGTPGGHDGGYFIVSVRSHLVATEGTTGSIVQSLECTPAALAYHPPRRTRIPVVQGLESAVVVGEGDEEIHTDEHRRVRVQFHWDRRGEKNHNSSCWIRVAQMWAGEGWGTLFLPRVGMEVIVSFLGGHPHRPIVIGSLYNGANPPPYTSDEDITKSTIKTSSSPGGDGFNELRFEDAAGSEEIFIHAQKDMNEVIENNHSTSVGGNQTNSVTGDRTHSVDKNETITVTGSQKVTISGAETGDGQDIQGAQLDITGKYKLDASDEIMVQAPNKVRIDVGSTYIEMTPSQIKLHCGGSTLILEGAQAELKSNGNSVVRLNADAKVVSSGAAEIYLNAHGKMSSAAGSNVHLEGANAKLVASAGANLELSANAEMSGTQAKVAGTAKAEMSGGTEAKVVGGGGSVTAAVAGVDVAGPQVNVTGQAMTNIAGAVVKIN